MKKISIYNRKGKRLAALFHEPDNDSNKIIIFSHSFKGDKDYQPFIGEFSKKICLEGYAALRYDCFGSGESEGSFEDSTVITQIEDLKDVIRYARSLNYSNICLMGLSLGTTNSIMAYEDDIKCMVLLSPPFEHTRSYNSYKNEILKNGFIVRKRDLTGETVKVGKSMWESFNKINTRPMLSKLNCPVMLILGSEDKMLSAEKTKKFMEIIPSYKKLEVIEGAGHDFLEKEGKNKMINLSVDFIKKHF